MKGYGWLIVSAVVAYFYFEHQQQSIAQPLLPGVQPAGCLPGDPSISFGGKTYCIPQGVIPY